VMSSPHKPLHLLMIMAVYSEQARPDPAWWNIDLEVCDYHGHESKEERALCG
jgi:hypothetical protein